MTPAEVVGFSEAEGLSRAGVAADAGSAAETARAAAQVTPIEEARKRELRIRPILDIVIHICPSGN